MRLIAVLAMMAVATCHVFALPSSHYAASSKLASGKWAKVQVAESGMQLISNSTLKNLGFSDPDKVNVYGYGGRMLPEQINSATPDDLPAIPSVRTPAGIVFFGHACVSWTASTSTSGYSHNLNPYSQSAYYFISDIEGERKSPASSDIKTVGSEPVTIFTERILHEQDLIAPSNSGRILLGEDFRTQSTRNFNFNLPGNIGDATARIMFGAMVSNGQSSILVSANGTQLPATNSDKIPGVGSLETFLTTTSSIKTIPSPGEKLNLSIKYSYSGAIYTAALDYIEVFYPRLLRLDKDELYFYLSLPATSDVKVEGCSESTVIWDVTDPINPSEVGFKLEGSDAFFASTAGYREYVAFDPSRISRSVKPAGRVANQDIHALEAPDMLIIAPALFMNSANRLAEIHNKRGDLKVEVIQDDKIYNEFSSGASDVTAFRKLLKMWYDRRNDNSGRYARYCLLFSRPTYDNKMVTPSVKRQGYPRLPIWQSAEGFSTSTSYSTDDYIGMLNDNTASLNMDRETIHVAVGRMPVKSVEEAENAVAKLENYMSNPSPGAWRGSVMVIADDQDNGDHLQQAEDVIEGMKASANGNRLIYEKLYLDSYPLVLSGTGATYPEAKQRMMGKINEGVAFINYIGHANPREWGHEKLLTWTDITSMSNRNLPFIYAATCEFMNWDDDKVSGGEEMWLNPNAGIIGMICPSRKVFIPHNGVLNANTSPFFYGADDNGMPLRVGDFMINGKNRTTNDNIKLRYGLMGDPSIRLPMPTMTVEVDSIGGIAIGADPELPVLKARSKSIITGRILNQDGSLAENFNGTMEIKLFDAEKAVTTHGNGDKGTPMTYNDRKTRLLSTKAKIAEGKWRAQLLIPSEIENNYCPAMLSMYAFDESGREASGVSEQLYVYGFNEDTDDDIEGPEISMFYLNSPTFADGDVTGPSPKLYAEVSDPSGINLSEAGIGHSMSLSLDGKTLQGDISSYFSPDSEDPGSGSISYQMNDIQPGEHELKLTVWDNANNSSSANLKFSVKAGWLPSISKLTTDVSPAVSSVTFIVNTDAHMGASKCHIEVFNLSGVKVWSSDATSSYSGASSASIPWNLRDTSGQRVARGIYIYRATIITTEGAEITKTNKLAVAAG